MTSQLSKIKHRATPIFGPTIDDQFDQCDDQFPKIHIARMECVKNKLNARELNLMSFDCQESRLPLDHPSYYFEMFKFNQIVIIKSFCTNTSATKHQTQKIKKKLEKGKKIGRQ